MLAIGFDGLTYNGGSSITRGGGCLQSNANAKRKSVTYTRNGIIKRIFAC